MIWKRKHRHKWRVQFAGIWHGAYVDCETCPSRDVLGSDSYAYTAWPWILDGTAPPPSFLAEIGNRDAQHGRFPRHAHPTPPQEGQAP